MAPLRSRQNECTKMVVNQQHMVDSSMVSDGGHSSWFSLSLDCPLSVEIPTDHCTSLSPNELKEWVWNQYQDKIFKALRLENQSERNEVSKEEEEEENEKDKNKESFAPFPRSSNKKQRISRKTNGPLCHGGRVDNDQEHHLLDTIAHVQREFFQNANPKVVFGGLLEGLLNLMSSEYGFIGEIKYEDDGTMYLQSHAITNIAWNQATSQFYEDNINAGKFYCSDVLLDPILVTERERGSGFF